MKVMMVYSSWSMTKTNFVLMDLASKNSFVLNNLMLCIIFNVYLFVDEF